MGSGLGDLVGFDVGQVCFEVGVGVFGLLIVGVCELCECFCCVIGVGECLFVVYVGGCQIWGNFECFLKGCEISVGLLEIYQCCVEGVVGVCELWVDLYCLFEERLCFCGLVELVEYVVEIVECFGEVGFQF